MLTVTVKGKLDELARVIGTESPKKIRQQTAIAINATARTTIGLLAKEIYKELATTQKAIKTTISVASKANASKLGATVRHRKTSRLSLKEFGAKQNAKGVSYQISRTKGRKTIDGFMGPKPGAIALKLRGHAFKRKGKARLPITKLHGPSTWGITVKNRLDRLVAKRDVEPELIKQINKRIRAIQFKRAQGR